MNQNINAEIAEILGAFIGDGWIEASLKGLYITGNIIEDREYYDKYLAPLFSKNFCDVTPRKFEYWGVYGIPCYKKEIIKWCLNFGFKPGLKALDVKIPEEILNARDKNIINAVIRGIFDANGFFWCERSNTKTSTLWKRTHHY